MRWTNPQDLEDKADKLYATASRAAVAMLNESLCKGCLVAAACTIGCYSFNKVHNHMWRWLVRLEFKVSESRMEQKFWQLMEEHKPKEYNPNEDQTKVEVHQTVEMDCVHT